MERENIDISFSAIYKIILLIISLYFLYLLKDLIVWVIFGVIISIVANFFIDFLERKKIPRIIAAILIYVGSFSLIGVLLWKSGPIIEKEILQIIDNLPIYLNQLSPLFKMFGINVNFLHKLLYPDPSNFEKIGQSAFLALSAIFGNISWTIFTITLAFFLSLQKDIFVNLISLILPEKYKERLILLWRKSEQKVIEWFLVRIISCIFLAVSVYIVLYIFQVRYSFLLAILAGILDFVPYLGGIFAGVLIFFTGLIDSPLKAIFSIISFIALQIIQNNIFSPLFFRKIMNISPSLVLLSLVVGERLWGPLGAVLAIPLLGILSEFLKEYFLAKNISQN
ncbi:MAG: AI-2E family transporter [Minisyncoccia bacterium]